MAANDTEDKVVIKSSDMDNTLQEAALTAAKEALNKFTLQTEMAKYIKKYFDQKFEESWHCIVGRNFGSFVTHESNGFIYFYIGQNAILLFKTTKA